MRAASAGALTRVEWKGLELPARLNRRDAVQAHGLARPVTYVRLVRRKLLEHTRISAQLVCQGTPDRKPPHQVGTGSVGLDLGPSTSAVISTQTALLQPFCPEVAPETKALRRLDRQLDRKLRANTPANYDERGRVKRGPQRWKVAKRQRKVQARRRELHRKLTRHAQAQPRAARSICCWPWAAPSIWSSSPIGPGRRPTGSRSSSAPLG